MAELRFHPAPLSEPLYYLSNARQLIHWSLTVHSDLLLENERRQLKTLLALPAEAQALLIRMVMRKGELFRSDSLYYEEIPDNAKALSQLASALFINEQPELTLDELGYCCRKPECLGIARYLLPDEKLTASVSKSRLISLLQEHFDSADSRPLKAWWPDAPFQLFRLNCMALFDRLRLMFFGNLHQDWSEFVLTELGLQKYEPVELSRDSRAFEHRSDVDLYFTLHQIQEESETAENIASVLSLLPDEPENIWLNQRYQKLLFQLGHSAERQDNTATALSLYQRSTLTEAKIRLLRVMEKGDTPAAPLFSQAQEFLQQTREPELQLSFERICYRTARKAGINYKKPALRAIPEHLIELEHNGELSVEQAVVQHLAGQSETTFHVESRLFNSLFALLFWPVLYAPVKGAFFNPFQSAPADLYRPEFNQLRQREIQTRLRLLDTDQYRKAIMATYRNKLNTRCSLIHWPTLSEELISLALQIIPANDLKSIFQRLLLDIKNHKRGLPDLISFNTAQHAYQMIEVKGPGDRLQDHQRLWISFLVEQGITSEVWNIRWHPLQKQPSAAKSVG